MICTICDGTGELAGQPKCWYCRGTGRVNDGTDYVTRHHEHAAKPASKHAALKATYGKNGLPPLKAIR